MPLTRYDAEGLLDVQACYGLAPALINQNLDGILEHSHTGIKLCLGRGLGSEHSHDNGWAGLLSMV